MIEFVEWLRLFIHNYPMLQYIVVFIGAGFGGEIAVISLSFLAAQGVFYFYPFLIVSFLGTLSGDILWFLLGRTKAVTKMISHRYAHGPIALITETVHKVSRGNYLVALILTKFMVGTRVLLIMYVSRADISLKKFSLLNTMAVALWLLVVIPIGFVSGLGFTFMAEIFETIYAGIGFLLLVIAGIVMMQLWLKKRFTQNQE